MLSGPWGFGGVGVVRTLDEWAMAFCDPHLRIEMPVHSAAGL